MRGVGAGRVVGDRYLLNERRAHLDDLEVWVGTDQRLGREVGITLLGADHPRAAALLDAARRVAPLDDDRLVRVLDVGSRGPVSWVVEETLSDSASLAHLLRSGPLPADEARRLAGEVATVLDVASRRGLHHLHLTPHAVRRTQDGRIKLAGLETAAAIEGTPELPSGAALRRDAVGTVALLYAALTTRWPLSTSVPGLEPAPRIVGGVAAPSEIAVSVPGDLDVLCRRALGGSGGPRTPADLASQLSPWSDMMVEHAQTKLTPHAQPRVPTEEIPVVAPASSPATEPVAGLAGTVAGAGGVVPVPTSEPTEALSVPPVAPPTEIITAGAESATSAAVTEAIPTAGRSAAPEGWPGAGEATSTDPGPAPAGGAGRLENDTAQSATERTASTSGAAGVEAAAGALDAGSAGAAAAAAAGAAASQGGSSGVAGGAGGAAGAAAGAAVAGLAGAAGAKMGSFARAAADKAAALRTQVATAREDVAAKTEQADAGRQIGIRESLAESGASRVDPPAPLLRQRPGHRDGAHAGIVLGVVGALVLGAAAYAVPNVLNLPKLGGAAAPSASATKKASASRTTAPRAALSIVSATGFDPLGDQSEFGSRAPLAYDGNAETMWQSEGYRNSARMGGIKDGVGVAFRVAAKSRINSVVLTLPDQGQDLTVYVSDERSLDEAEELGKLTDATGTKTLTASAPLTGQWVIVWFTKAAAQGDNVYRASLAEIRIS